MLRSLPLGLFVRRRRHRQGAGAVVYGVELVSINFNSDPAAKRDNFYTGDPCDEAAFESGNASGMCRERSSATVPSS